MLCTEFQSPMPGTCQNVWVVGGCCGLVAQAYFSFQLGPGRTKYLKGQIIFPSVQTEIIEILFVEQTENLKQGERDSLSKDEDIVQEIIGQIQVSVNN